MYLGHVLLEKNYKKLIDKQKGFMETYRKKKNSGTIQICIFLGFVLQC